MDSRAAGYPSCFCVEVEGWRLVIAKAEERSLKQPPASCQRPGTRPVAALTSGTTRMRANAGGLAVGMPPPSQVATLRQAQDRRRQERRGWGELRSGGSQ